MSGKTYNVNATVSYSVDVITTFIDDGKTDLGDQAVDAAINYAVDEKDMPTIAVLEGELEVQDLVYEEDN